MGLTVCTTRQLAGEAGAVWGRGRALPPPSRPLRSWYPQRPFSGGKAIKTRDPPAVPVWLGRTATTLTHCLHAWSLHSFGWEGCDSCSQGAGRYAVPNLWLRRCGQALAGCYAACKIRHVSEVWKTLEGFVQGKIQDGDVRVGDRDFTWGASFRVIGSERPEIRQGRFGLLWEMGILNSPWKYQELWCVMAKLLAPCWKWK